MSSKRFKGREFGIIDPPVGTCTSASPCSLVVFLHGIGERGPLRAMYGSPTWKIRFPDRSFCSACYRSLRSVIISPQLVEHEMWNEDLVRDEVIPLVRSVLVERASSLDVDRVYCNGNSIGAQGAFLAALHGANLFSMIAASSPVNFLDIVTTRAPWSSVGGKKLQKIVVATGSIDRVHINAGGGLIWDGTLLNHDFLDFLNQTRLESEITIDHHTYDGGDHFIWTSFDNLNERWLWAGEHPFALQETSVAVHDFPVSGTVPPVVKIMSAYLVVCLILTCTLGALMLLPIRTPAAQQMPSQRLDDIEVARGVMCLLIFVAHFFLGRRNYTILQHKEHCVWNFVAISGYMTHRTSIFNLSMWDSSRCFYLYCFQRCIRVAISYEFACVFSFVVILPQWTYAACNALLLRTWWTFAMLQSWTVAWTTDEVGALNLPLWIVNGLLLCWLIYPLLSKMLASLRLHLDGKKRQIILAAATVGAYMTALCNSPSKPWGEQFFPPWCLPPFFCGVLVYEQISMVQLPHAAVFRWVRPGMCTMASLLALSYFEESPHLLARTWQLPLVTIMLVGAEIYECSRKTMPPGGVSVSVFAVAFEKGMNLAVAPLKWLGNLSLAFYVLQFPIAQLVARSVDWRFPLTFGANDIHNIDTALPQFRARSLGVCLVLLFTTSAVFTKCIEAPVIRWLKAK